MGIIQKNLEVSYGFNPWFLFYDRAMAPFWYNFNTGTHVRADPNNLAAPPLDDESKDITDMGTTAPLEPDDKLEQGQAGSQTVGDTVYAKYASESAVFNVPPAMNIR